MPAIGQADSEWPERAGFQILPIASLVMVYFDAPGFAVPAGIYWDVNFKSGLLRFRLFLLGLISRIESMLEGHQIFAGVQGIKRSLLGLDLLVGIIGGLNRKPDAAVALINLDHASGDFLADFQDVLDLINALFADL